MNLIVGLLSFLFLDSIYLHFIKDYYGKQIKLIQGASMSVNMLAAAIVYILIGIQWYVFIYKKINKTNMVEMVTKAFILGFTTYGIFDFTNLALFKDYTLKTALIDTIWGGILYKSVTFIQYLI